MQQRAKATVDCFGSIACPETLLASLLAQLCRRPNVPQPIESLFSLCKQAYPPTSPSLTVLKDTFEAMVRSITSKKNDQPEQRVFLLLDGLDEIKYGEREEVFQLVIELREKNIPGLQLLVASRDQADIRSVFANWEPIPIKTHLVKADIERFVASAIEASNSLRSIPNHTKEAIIERLSSEEKGVIPGNGMQVEPNASMMSESADMKLMPTSIQVSLGFPPGAGY